MRPVVAELDPAIGLDAIPGGDLDADLAAMSIALASGNEEGTGGADRKPPAVIGVALVKDIEPAPAQAGVAPASSGTARPATTPAFARAGLSTLAEVTSNHTGRRCRGS
jgi:hypothetical protein